MANPDIQAILGFLAQPGNNQWPIATETWISLCDESEIEELVDSLCAVSPPLSPEHQQYWDWLIDQILTRLSSQPAWECQFHTELFTNLYAHLGAVSKSRNLLIQFLARRAFQEDLQALVDVLISDPPIEELHVGTALAPLIQNADLEWELIFPALLEGINNPVTAASILDLANFATRKKYLAEHPAADMVDHLNMMLSTIVKQLDVLSEKVGAADELQDVAQQVEQAVALAVSLCDSLALIESESSIPALNQAMELTHRRVQTEAAAALAKLGDEHGENHLIELVSHPIARLRVLQYAREIGIEGKLNPEFTTPEAIAESQLAIFLSEPTQLGFPPQILETVESRTCFWPGFDDPVTNHLIRFRYEMGDMHYENTGISGAMTFAIGEDLCGLSHDEIYAYFAGIHAEHDDIYELSVDQLTEPQRIDANRCERKILDAGFESVEPVLLGRLFEHTALVACAVQDGITGFVIASAEEIQWINQAPTTRPLTAYQAYDIYKGTVLLRTFNP